MKKRDCDWVLFLGIAVCMFIGMFVFSDKLEFWYDEVYQLGLVRPGVSISQLFQEYMQLKDYTPPLYALLCYFWVRLVPFSFRYLLLLSEIMVAAGVFLVAKTGKCMAGRGAGFWAEILAATSSVLVISVGYEFRSYALYFMIVSLIFFLLCRRIKEGKECNVIYTVALSLLLYSHYYGSIIFGALFIIEVIFALWKKQRGKILFTYVVAGMCFVPWMIFVFLNHTRSLTEFWIQSPNWRSLIELLEYLSSDNWIMLALFAVSMVLAICRIAVKIGRKKFEFVEDSMMVYLFGVFFLVVILMYLYGVVINPSGGIFYNRYFIGLLPCLFLGMAEYLIWFWELWKISFHTKRILFSGLSLVLCMLLVVGEKNIFFEKISQEQNISYLSAAQLICEDAGKMDSVVVATDNPYVCAGVEMYCKEFFQKEQQIISQFDEKFDEKVLQYDNLILFYGKQRITDETRQFLTDYKRIKRNREKRVSVFEKRKK